jgi:hypothetical protein
MTSGSALVAARPPHRVTNGARIKVNHCIRGLVRRTMRVPTDGLGTVKRLLRCDAGPCTVDSLWRYHKAANEGLDGRFELHSWPCA